MTAEEILFEEIQIGIGGGYTEDDWEKYKELEGDNELPPIYRAMERYANQRTQYLQAHILHFKNIIFDVGVNTMDEEVLKLHDKYVEIMGITTQRTAWSPESN